MKQRRTLWIVLAALLVLIGALLALFLPKDQAVRQTPVGVNLLANGDFESFGIDSLPEAWYTDSYENIPDVTAFGMADGREGKAAYIRSNEGNDARFAQVVDVEPDSLYCLRGYVKANASGGHGANLSVEGVYVFSNSLYDTAGEWQEAVLYGRTGSEQTTVTVFARLGGYSGVSMGEAWFDDLTFMRVDSVPGAYTAQDFYIYAAPVTNTSDGETDSTGAPMLLFVIAVYAAVFYLLSYPKKSAPDKPASVQRLLLFAGLITLCALALRVVVALNVPGYDVDIGCFTSWANTAAQVGPSGFYSGGYFCDYPPGYILILWIVGLLGRLFGTGATEFLVKLPPMLADLLGGLLLMRFAVSRLKEKYGEGRAWNVGFSLLILYLLNPLPILSGAGWGQSDSVMTLFLLLTVLSALSGKWRYALPMYMLSVLVKPQALMFGPLGLLALIAQFVKKRGDKDSFRALVYDALIGFGALCAAFLAVVVPFSVRQGGFSWLFDLYQNTMSSYGYASVNACNAYFLFGCNWKSTADIAPKLLTLFMGLTLSVPSLLVYLKKDAAKKTRFLALAVCIAGALLAAFGMIVSMTFALLGGLLIGLSILIVFAAYILRGDIRRLPLLGAALLILLFNTGTMMHERYLFPALILLIVAYVMEKDARVMLLMLLLTASLTLNVGCVLDRNIRIGDAAGHLTAPAFSIESDMAALEYLSCALNAIACGLALYLSLRLTDENAPRYMPKDKALSDQPPKEYALSDEKSAPLAGRKMTRADWIITLSVTAMYALLTFLNLGSVTAPQTDYRFPDENEQVVFDLGENQSAFRMLYYGGIHYRDSAFTVEVSSDGVNYGSPYTCQMAEGSCFQWQYVQGYTVGDMRNLSGRYVRLTAGHIGLTLFEVLFRDVDGNVLPVKSVTDSLGADVRALTDEQDTLSGEPGWYNSMYFDEIYHARTAYELLHGLSIYEWTHPQLGKNLMSLCVMIFGMTPFGWRFAGALCGVLMLPGMYLLGKLLFKKRRYAVMSMLLLTFDCMHFAQTRIATVDSFVVLFIIWAVYFMLRWFCQDFFGQKFWKTLIPLALSGLFMGFAIASKWTGCYAGVGLAVLFFYGVRRRALAAQEAKRAIGSGKKRKKGDPPPDPYALKAASEGVRRLLWTVASCLIFFVLVPCVIYYCSYIPHFAASGGVSVKKIIELSVGTYFTNGQTGGMLGYHAQPGFGMDHRFYTPWYEWPLSIRPMYFAADHYEPNGYAASILSFGNPAVWWVGALCLLILLYAYLRHQAYPKLTHAYREDKTFLLAPKGERDARPALILISFAAQFFPWVLVPRGTYLYHYFPSVPFVILSICMVAEYLSEYHVARAIAKEKDEKRADRAALYALIGYLALVFALFVAFFPYASGLTVRTEWLQAMNWLGWMDKGWLFY